MDYSDILHLPHHRSTSRPHMSLHDRAGQFAPFAALVGYGAAIDEMARLTEQQTELDESCRLEIGEKLHRLSEHTGAGPVLTVTWFRPDERKSGGFVRTDTAAFQRADPYDRLLYLSGGLIIPFSQIYALESDFFY